jgi:hypothetical protein
MVSSPKGLGPEKDCAGKASSMYKRQTRPLVREGSPQKQGRNCQKINKYLVNNGGSNLRRRSQMIEERLQQLVELEKCGCEKTTSCVLQLQ